MSKDIYKRYNITVSGTGSQPLLFANGFGCDQAMWRFVAPTFENDYRVIRFDYIGSGNSDVSAYDPERYAHLEGYAQDVLDICTALQLKEVIFVGHSVSSMIGVLAAKRAPEQFAHLILLCPSPCYINEPPSYIGGFEREDLLGLIDLMDKNDLSWVDMLAPLVMQNEERPELTTELAGSFCATDPVIARQFAEVTFFSDNRADLPYIHVPTLIIQSTNDLIAPHSVGEYVHRSLSESKLYYLPANGHCPHMSHPDETIQLIQKYLTEADYNVGESVF